MYEIDDVSANICHCIRSRLTGSRRKRLGQEFVSQFGELTGVPGI